MTSISEAVKCLGSKLLNILYHTSRNLLSFPPLKAFTKFPSIPPPLTPPICDLHVGVQVTLDEILLGAIAAKALASSRPPASDRGSEAATWCKAWQAVSPAPSEAEDRDLERTISPAPAQASVVL